MQEEKSAIPDTDTKTKTKTKTIDITDGPEIPVHVSEEEGDRYHWRATITRAGGKYAWSTSGGLNGPNLGLIFRELRRQGGTFEDVKLELVNHGTVRGYEGDFSLEEFRQRWGKKSEDKASSTQFSMLSRLNAGEDLD